MSKVKVIDGNEAAAYVAYAFTEVSAIYPITPSSPMAEKVDEWSANGLKNIFGQEASLVELQSEAGAIGTVHGALQAGVYATTFTSSQGLMLMLPVMHRIAGERLPQVMHVAARTVGTHSMSIFGDHSDVMNCRGTGYALLASGSPQESMDLAAVAHLASIGARMPFMHFFDGFRTSHEIQNVNMLEYDDLSALVDWDAVRAFKQNSLSPNHPTLRNTVQNPDVYFQSREAANVHYDTLPDTVEYYMDKINALTGNDYKVFNYYGDKDADRVIVAMGSVCGTIMETIDALSQSGEKVGMVQVRLFRPFAAKKFLSEIPKTTKFITVLDRTKESGSIGEPLFQDVCTVFAGEKDSPTIFAGRYGLSSKDTDPAQIKTVYDNMQNEEAAKKVFTIGITDDLTKLSLVPDRDFVVPDEGTISCKFWGLGSDGTVGANKNSIKIIGEGTDLNVQAYFEYDTKKSFGITKSHLRFGKNKIRSSYLVKSADFIACHNEKYMKYYDIVSELKHGGEFLLSCSWDDADIGKNLSGHVRRVLAEKQARMYVIDAAKIAEQLGLKTRSNIVLQAAFFKITEIVPIDEAIEYMTGAIKRTYGKKGENVVNLNISAIRGGIDGVRAFTIPDDWKDAEDEPGDDAAYNFSVENFNIGESASLKDFAENILKPLNFQKGDDLPVSFFKNYSDGTMPLGVTAFEKRGIATRLPKWNKENCLQCNICAFVCPHAVIRPYLLSENEAKDAPGGFDIVEAKGQSGKDLYYSLQVSNLDCTGCGSCSSVCPAKDKAIAMVPAEEKAWEQTHWEFGLSITEKEGCFEPKTVKGSQFKQPLCEFSGACAGCGETPYAKLLTQLFGDRMYWANGTGCSQAWAAAMPSIAYTADKNGRGPAWSNSLFENNAEFSLGMLLATKQQRKRLKAKVTELLDITNDEDVVYAAKQWLETYDDTDKSVKTSDELISVLNSLNRESLKNERDIVDDIMTHGDELSKKSIWMYGGDGWAYDIGYGGLDHVVSLGEDVNIFVIDTEVYSNTGGQSSKATPMGAVAQFQASGKKSPKKNLGRIMMSYGNVYVASVAMGGDYSQLVKAIAEAEAYPGPSVIVAYTPCIAHGIKIGMENVQEEMKRAVQSGYWPLYRFNPRAEDGHPLKIDSKPPSIPYKEFLDGEVRYSSLEVSFPVNADELFAKAGELAENDYNELVRLSQK